MLLVPSSQDEMDVAEEGEAIASPLSLPVVAASQAGGSLHTMAMMQAYQADLLKDLDHREGLSPKTVAELCYTTDLALRATKQTAVAIGCSIVLMVAKEKHL